MSVLTLNMNTNMKRQRRAVNPHNRKTGTKSTFDIVPQKSTMTMRE